VRVCRRRSVHPSICPIGGDETFFFRVSPLTEVSERPLEDRANEEPAQTALDACADIAMGRGQLTLLPNAEPPVDDHQSARDRPSVAIDHGGFNLHAGLRIEAGDDVGRERLCRYGARPPLSLDRLRRLSGGRVAYRLKYVGRGRGKHRVMTPMELMARLAALIPPPRYPLVRYAGVLGPHSSWRKDVVPRPREHPKRQVACAVAHAAPQSNDALDPAPQKTGSTGAACPAYPSQADQRRMPVTAVTPSGAARPSAGDRGRLLETLLPNVISIRHWDRLFSGALWAATPRVDWARLLRRTFDVDVMQCPKCQGRLRVLAVITDRTATRRILAHLGLATEAPAIARARDPTDDLDDAAQLELGFA
jgi:hypothetical protein